MTNCLNTILQWQNFNALVVAFIKVRLQNSSWYQHFMPACVSMNQLLKVKDVLKSTIIWSSTETIQEKEKGEANLRGE